LEKENSEDLGKELFIQGICFNEILFEIFNVGWNLILCIVLESNFKCVFGCQGLENKPI
jgi:hypothetical protein